MASSKYTPSLCINHRTVKAIGKCKTCGKPLCGQCALMYKGDLYCVKTCIPPAILKVNPPEPPKKKGHIGLWAFITLFLFTIAAASFIAREYFRLKQEVFELRESRMHLVETLKQNNQHISSIPQIHDTSESPQFAPVAPQSTMQTPGSFSQPYQPDSRASYSFENGSANLKLVSLTFDGASEANVAEQILDTLRSRNVKATLFLTGHFLRKYPDIVRAFLADGHEIGNHTFSHLHLTTYAQNQRQTTRPDITRDVIIRELEKNAELYYSITGQKIAPLWRAPYGEFNKAICTWASEAGYIHIGWRQGKTWKQGLDSNDWIPDENTPGFKTPSEVFDKILVMARSNSDALNGGIILMHLGTSRKDPQMQVYTILGALIDSLSQRNYQFTKVSDMAQRSGFYLASSSPKIHFLDSLNNN